MEKYVLQLSSDNDEMIIPKKDIYISQQHLNIISDLYPEDVPTIIDSKGKIKYNKFYISYISEPNPNITDNKVLSQEGNCWVGPHACIWVSASGRTNIHINDNALVFGTEQKGCILRGNNIIIDSDALVYKSKIYNKSNCCNVCISDKACLLNSILIIEPNCDADIIISGYTSIINSTIRISATRFPRNARITENYFEKIYIVNAVFGDKDYLYEISISSNSINNDHQILFISDDIPGDIDCIVNDPEYNTEIPDIKFRKKYKENISI